MTLPVSGAISMSQVNTELNLAATANISLNAAAVRTLFGKASGVISLNDGHGKSNRKQISVVYGSNVANQTMNASAQPGYSAGKSDIIITINSGVYVYSTATGTPGLVITGFSAGDTCALINNGSILGMGGAGGNGGSSGTPTGGNGGSGGTGLSLGYAVTITNGSGFIYGGGGGGGGGGIVDFKGYPDGGGGGGGGQSSLTNSSGGAGGSGSGGGSGGAGGIGTVSAAGSGGAAGSVTIPNPGGGGGTFGVAGGNGTTGSSPGGSGGAAGKAIALNGNAVTWISGNDSTHVKGAVS